MEIRTLIVDDNKMFIHSLQNYLSNFPYIKIVGAMNSPKKALQEYKNLKPDLVLLDIFMPELNGFKVLKEIQDFKNHAKVVMITMHDQREYAEAAKEANADGFITKTDLHQQFESMMTELFGNLE